MQTYTEWLLSKDKSTNTIKRYLTVLKEYEKWKAFAINQELDNSQISAIEIRDYKNYLKNVKKNKNGTELAISTINNTLESLKTYFRYLQETNQRIDNPLDHIKIQKVQGNVQPKWLTRNEKNTLLRYIESEEMKAKNPWKFYRNMAIVHIMLQAGLRVSEVVNLKLDNIQNGMLFIRDSKGEKSRMIPIPKDLSIILKNWYKHRNQKELMNTNNVFTSQKSGPLSISGINKLFETIRKQTHLSFLTPHTLRHTYCHDLATNNINILQIASLAGHSDLETTRGYCKPSMDELKNSVEVLSTGKYIEE